jgi:hypothetical protein
MEIFTSTDEDWNAAGGFGKTPPAMMYEYWRR